MQKNVTVFNEKTKADVILPFNNEGEYYVEDLGEIEKKPIYSFWKRFFCYS